MFWPATLINTDAGHLLALKMPVNSGYVMFLCRLSGSVQSLYLTKVDVSLLFLLLLSEGAFTCCDYFF